MLHRFTTRKKREIQKKDFESFGTCWKLTRTVRIHRRGNIRYKKVTFCLKKKKKKK